MHTVISGARFSVMALKHRRAFAISSSSSPSIIWPAAYLGGFWAPHVHSVPAQKGIIEISFGIWGKFRALQLLPSCFRVTCESREIESNSELSQVIGDEHVAYGRAPARRPQTDVHPGAVTKRNM